MSQVLELSDVTKVFGKKTAVSGVSLKLTKGEIYGFLGPNGAGKTTTIRMIMDFIRPSSGTVSLFGNNANPADTKKLAKVGFLSADSVLYPSWNAQQHIAFVESQQGPSKTARELAKRFGLDVYTKYRKLSSGNKQKMALVLALMNDPELLILDEPTRGLDPLLQQEMYDILLDFKRAGGTVFMSSHNLAEVQKVCDHIGIIKDGRMVASETMAGLRNMHVHQVSVQFDETIAPKTFELANVEITKVTSKEIIATVRGDLNQFMKLVTRYKIRDIEVGHISLEEMFMRYYEK